MTMEEIVDEVAFRIDEYVEPQQISKAVLIAFRELKRYMTTPTKQTVPYAHRIDLNKVGIHTKRVVDVIPAIPRVGLAMSSIDAGNVFQVAAAVKSYSAIGQTNNLDIQPIVNEMARSQIRNAISTDFQWTYDRNNSVIYVTHRDPLPTHVTISYVPDYQDVSEINSDVWIDYLIRLSEAHMKKALGRRRSKYTIEGSNVSLDGEILLNEANAEFEKIREELSQKKKRIVVLN